MQQNVREGEGVEVGGVVAEHWAPSSISLSSSGCVCPLLVMVGGKLAALLLLFHLACGCHQAQGGVWPSVVSSPLVWI